jgi:hypothetical protein
VPGDTPDGFEHVMAHQVDRYAPLIGNLAVVQTIDPVGEEDLEREERQP